MFVVTIAECNEDRTNIIHKELFKEERDAHPYAAWVISRMMAKGYTFIHNAGMINTCVLEHQTEVAIHRGTGKTVSFKPVYFINIEEEVF